MTGTEANSRWRSPRQVAIALALSVAPLAIIPAGPAAAQTSASAADQNVAEIRIRKLEAEVRALQRQVFPGGDGTYFPKSDPSAGGSTAAQVGTPAATPVTDLLARMDSVEAQIARLTAQNEDIQNRLSRLDGGGKPAAVAGPVAPVVPVAPRTEVTPKPAALAPVATPKPTVAAKPSAARVAAVKAIVKPATGDAGEDEYTYGYKLWEAKFYPEAEQQLKLFATQYPKHKRLTYARNLLGRAYLDEGKPREAADWFLANYQGGRKADRAPDSLLYLVQSLVLLKDTNRACIALGEFTDTYKSEAAGRLKNQYDATRATVTCS